MLVFILMLAACSFAEDIAQTSEDARMPIRLFNKQVVDVVDGVEIRFQQIEDRIRALEEAWAARYKPTGRSSYENSEPYIEYA